MTTIFEVASRGLVAAGFVSLGLLCCYGAWWQFRHMGEELRR